MRLSLILSLLLISSMAKAYDINVDGICYDFTSDSTVSVTYYNRGINEEYQGNIVIPTYISNKGKKYRVTAIGENAFFFSYYLESVVIPLSIITIGADAFYKCGNLENVVIPYGVKELSQGVFGHCGSMKSITIPSSVTTIGDVFIFDCHRLEEIICKSRIPPTVEKETFRGLKSNQKIVVKVPKGTVNAYKNAEGWKDFEIIEET